MSPIVIIGAGLAGYTLAREIRALDKTVAITLISADDAAFYSKPMLSTALAKGQSADDLVNAPATAMAERLNIQILAATQVSAIDRISHQIQTTRGAYTYDHLVLATGAQPIRLPLQGDAADRVFSVNSRGDYARYRTALGDSPRRVAILGPGLIGCEFANDLIASGHRVSVIGPDPHPISALLPAPAGRALQQTLADAGVNWLLGRTVQRVEPHGDHLMLQLSDGDEIEVDLVLSAVGLRADLGLAQAAGLACGRAITVDAQMRSSDANIYALGDAAEQDGAWRPYVMPITLAAKALAKTLVGTPMAVSYPPMPVIVKTPAYPVALVPAQGPGNWDTHTVDGGMQMEWRDDHGKLRGFVLTGPATAGRQALVKQLA